VHGRFHLKYLGPAEKVICHFGKTFLGGVCSKNKAKGGFYPLIA
jgi:hypothetical protein